MTAELLDIVNDDNQVMGQENRATVHQSGRWHRGVHIFLFTPDRKLIVQQRSLTRLQSPGALDCSVSEHLKAGESYFEAAMRGLREELLIDPIPLTRLLQFKLDYAVGDNMISELFTGVAHSSAVRFDRLEVEQIYFLNLAEIENLANQAEIPMSRWFKQLLCWYLGKSFNLEIIWKSKRTPEHHPIA